ncbi:MAG TPA: 6-carboxytetrahydropterin synthase, partial [Candidatus Saccharimonadales bacterium]|nr:6-carboxytetrahydropterin synthase [Candidatus Saccharimonadales bacterium]
MYTVSETIDFCYGHRLMEHGGGCGHLHGHNGRAEIVLEAPALDGRSMVEDFDRIGAIAGKWIAETLDHRTLLRRDDPLVALLGKAGEPLHVMEVNPTAEA